MKFQIRSRRRDRNYSMKFLVFIERSAIMRTINEFFS